jgi:hypothetical protein
MVFAAESGADSVNRPRATGACVRHSARRYPAVSFPDLEPLLAGLRRRRIILDSPRMLVNGDTRAAGGAGVD